MKEQQDVIDSKKPGSEITAARKRANEAFKGMVEVKPPSDGEIAKKAFDENRERLKRLRLAREAAEEKKSR